MSPRPTEIRRLVGRYRLDSELGRGAMGTVWSAYDEVLHRPVAVKEVRLSLVPVSERAIVRERTLREARATAMLSHPNVVTLYDVVEVNAEPYVVMELLPSRSLASYISERGTLSPAETAEIGSAVASALMTAHRAGITHRDVKPGNVLIGTDGQIKLTDFGIARNSAESSMTQTGTVLGSPPYIAPEVAMGRAVGPAADLWGLGATLFACLEGRPPYDAGDPVSTVSAVVHGEVPRPKGTGPVQDVVRGLMVKDPTLRMPLPAVRRRLRPLMADPEGPMLSAPPSPATTEFRLPTATRPSDDEARSGLIPVSRGRDGTLIDAHPPGPAPATPPVSPPEAPRTAPLASPRVEKAGPSTEDAPVQGVPDDASGETPAEAGDSPAADGAAGAVAAGAVVAGSAAAGTPTVDAPAEDEHDGDEVAGDDEAPAADGTADDEAAAPAEGAVEAPDDEAVEKVPDGKTPEEKPADGEAGAPQESGAAPDEATAPKNGTTKSGTTKAGTTKAVPPKNGSAKSATAANGATKAGAADATPATADADSTDDPDDAAPTDGAEAEAVPAEDGAGEDGAGEDGAVEDEATEDPVAEAAGAGAPAEDAPAETPAGSDEPTTGGTAAAAAAAVAGTAAAGTGAEAAASAGEAADPTEADPTTSAPSKADPSKADPTESGSSTSDPEADDGDPPRSGTTTSSGKAPSTPSGGTRTSTTGTGTPGRGTPSSGMPRPGTPPGGTPSAAETTMVTPRLPLDGGRPRPPGGPTTPGAWPVAGGPGYRRPPPPQQRRPGPPQALAADPGPLPFAPSRTPGPASGDQRRRRIAVIVLVVVLALAGLFGGYVVTRLVAGQPPFSISLAPDGPVVDGERMVAHSDDNARYSGTGLGFTALVPSTWQQFRLQEPGGDIVVRYVSDDADRELRIDRLVRFYPGQRAADYAQLLADPGRVGADAVRVEPLTEVTPARPGAAEAVQQTVYRARTGTTDDRTTWTRLIPSGADLWVVRMTAPSLAPGGAPLQFATVADSFSPPV